MQGDSFAQRSPSANLHPSQLSQRKRNEGQHFAVNSWLSENILWNERIVTTVERVLLPQGCLDVEKNSREQMQPKQL